MISAVIFDLDGTLVETEELKALSHARSVVELRPEAREEEVVAFYGSDLVGHSRKVVTETLIERFGLEEAARERMVEPETEPWQALVRIRRAIYETLLEDPELLLEKRYPFNIELLRKMRREGYPTGCATMSHRKQVDRVLSVLGLEDAFDVVVTMEDVKNGKPDPEIDLLVAEKLGVPPEEFLVIEDSPAGVGAAVAAGMMVVAVPTRLTGPAFRGKDLLDPLWTVDDPGEVEEVVSRRIEAAGGRRTEERIEGGELG